MINVNEVRLGNWVYREDGYNEQVEYVDERGINPIINEYPEFLYTYDPIPLTEEIFLNAGFDRKEYVPNDGIGDLQVSYTLNGYEFRQDNSGYWFLCGYNWNTKHFKYVHPLQNLYFALTGEELVIDL